MDKVKDDSASPTESCLVSRFAYYLDLREAEVSLLRSLEKAERHYQADSLIVSAGDPVNNLYVVKSGWLYSHNQLVDGSRLVVKIHHPGDIIGLNEMALHRSSTSLTTATETCLCPFAKADMDDVFLQSPRLTALLFSAFARDHVVLTDTLRAISRMQSPARIAFMMLDLISRLRINNREISDTFKMPLKQAVIGDALGLSNVSVSRSWSQMEKNGLLEKHGDQVTILDEAAMRNLCDFENRYRQIDISWFPEF